MSNYVVTKQSDLYTASSTYMNIRPNTCLPVLSDILYIDSRILAIFRDTHIVPNYIGLDRNGGVNGSENIRTRALVMRTLEDDPHADEPRVVFSLNSAQAVAYDIEVCSRLSEISNVSRPGTIVVTGWPLGSSNSVMDVHERTMMALIPDVELIRTFNEDNDDLSEFNDAFALMTNYAMNCTTGSLYVMDSSQIDKGLSAIIVELSANMTPRDDGLGSRLDVVEELRMPQPPYVSGGLSAQCTRQSRLF